mmetsp:Transcript_13686/g.18781  ORF Transcript_13686/g.18781 Transcript_13686/m.18781 type:complete len:484 (+) Transcript_13686:58-1509(+)|eukprot:CAMPEP_0196584974 /NCGR_PEP_ID=MMETSP1081-20130531/49178_1 /TAXON_ID=36882 /ORGANISM="Pyramimonas amylifera, Strain CCMP720" /LENGTH=483 /DNA_ID=CAMNT_0041906369 /DNA_START=56 /DNA_END=1507 /DNA_ORIENTATION=-
MSIRFVFTLIISIFFSHNSIFTQAQTQDWYFEPSLVKTILGPEDNPAFAIQSGIDTVFYSKYINANGIHVYGSINVSAVAITKAATVASKMLEKYPSYIEFMATNQMHIVVSRGRLIDSFASPILEPIASMPPYSIVGFESYQREAVPSYPIHDRGVWGYQRIPTSISEENLLCQQADQYKGTMTMFNNFAGSLFKKFGPMYRDSGTGMPATWSFMNGLYDTTCTSRAPVQRFTGTSACLSSGQLFAEASAIWFGGLAEPTECDCSSFEYLDFKVHNLTTWPAVTACVSEARNCVTTRERLKMYHEEIYNVLSVYYVEDDWTYTCPDGTKLDGSVAPSPPPVSQVPAATNSPTYSPTANAVTTSPTVPSPTSPGTVTSAAPTATKVETTFSPTFSPTLSTNVTSNTPTVTESMTGSPTGTPTTDAHTTTNSPTKIPTSLSNPSTAGPTVEVLDAPSAAMILCPEPTVWFSMVLCAWLTFLYRP